MGVGCTKCDTSAMCTQTRMVFLFIRVANNESSKSLAVSGSIASAYIAPEIFPRSSSSMISLLHLNAVVVVPLLRQTASTSSVNGSSLMSFSKSIFMV